LDAIQSGNGSYKSYASNWEKVKETLRNYEDFGKMLNLENPYQEDMRAMDLSKLPFKEKLQSVFELLKKKLQWLS
jgi:predicted translin family RNA/ssDNA-binding protein